MAGCLLCSPTSCRAQCRGKLGSRVLHSLGHLIELSCATAPTGVLAVTGRSDCGLLLLAARVQKDAG